MKPNQKLDELNYRQAQRRNSDRFNNSTRSQQQQLRKQGYKNCGWDNVRKSWQLLISEIAEPVNFVDFAIKKAENRYDIAKQKGDALELLAAGKAVIQSLKLKYQ
jgi:hypothetical protein